jgi:DNA repair ATPase RecN
MASYLEEKLERRLDTIERNIQAIANSVTHYIEQTEALAQRLDQIEHRQAEADAPLQQTEIRGFDAG